MTAPQSSHDIGHQTILNTVHHLSKREVTQLLLKPDAIDILYRMKGIALTSTRATDIKELIRAILRDGEHNPTTPQEARIRDIRADIAHLPLRDAIHFRRHPDCFIAWLVQTYKDGPTIVNTATDQDIADFHITILLIIEAHTKGI